MTPRGIMISVIFLIFALVLFLLAAIPTTSSRFNLVALGLAFWVASNLAGLLIK